MVKRKSRPQIPKFSEAMKIVAGKKILLAAMLVRVQVPPGVQFCTAKLQFRIKKVLQSYSVNTFFYGIIADINCSLCNTIYDNPTIKVGIKIHCKTKIKVNKIIGDMGSVSQNHSVLPLPCIRALRGL